MTVDARNLQARLAADLAHAPVVPEPRIAVLLPCHNEAGTIEAVVAGFRSALPKAEIYVFDNGSTDGTAGAAAAAGAVVRHEPERGKGNVVRRMFAEIEADIYVMADGDGTYDAESAHALVRRLEDESLDMVVGARARGGLAWRRGHVLGNRLFNFAVEQLFGRRLDDMLSGYRVFSRRFVKSFPALSSGFEIETELTVHALDLKMPIAELPVPYYARPEGSASKLRTLGDGLAILKTILLLLKEVRPFFFFGAIAAALGGAAPILAAPLFITYLETGLVPRFPTAILCTGLVILSFLSLASGVVLDSVSRFRRETKRLAYLAMAGR